MAWNTALVHVGSPVLLTPAQVRPFTAPHLLNIKGLSGTLAAIEIIINMGLFLPSIPTVSSVKLQTPGVISSGVDTEK